MANLYLSTFLASRYRHLFIFWCNKLWGTASRTYSVGDLVLRTGNLSKFYLFFEFCDLEWPLVKSYLFSKLWRQEPHFDAYLAGTTWNLTIDPKWPKIWNLTPNGNFYSKGFLRLNEHNLWLFNLFKKKSIITGIIL